MTSASPVREPSRVDVLDAEVSFADVRAVWSRDPAMFRVRSVGPAAFIAEDIRAIV